MSQNLKRISVAVDEEKYGELKNLSRPGISVGFLIREAINDFLEKTKKNLLIFIKTIFF